SLPDFSAALNGQKLTVTFSNDKWNVSPTFNTFPPVAGTWSMTVNGQTTTPLAFDADAATILAALEALPTVGMSNVSLQPASDNLFPAQSVILEFQAALAQQTMMFTAT